MRKRETRDSTGFAVRLREMRQEAGLSQEALARLANLSTRTVCKIEQGDAEPGWRTVLDLADALGVEVGCFRPSRPVE